MSKVNNPPAFPNLKDLRNQSHYETYEGMTLRDYFAAKAMHAYLTTPHSDFNLVGVNAYEVADMLLAEREKGGTGK